MFNLTIKRCGHCAFVKVYSYYILQSLAVVCSNQCVHTKFLFIKLFVCHTTSPTYVEFLITLLHIVLWFRKFLRSLGIPCRYRSSPSDHMQKSESHRYRYTNTFHLVQAPKLVCPRCSRLLLVEIRFLCSYEHCGHLNSGLLNKKHAPHLRTLQELCIHLHHYLLSVGLFSMLSY